MKISPTWQPVTAADHPVLHPAKVADAVEQAVVRAAEMAAAAKVVAAADSFQWVSGWHAQLHRMPCIIYITYAIY